MGWCAARVRARARGFGSAGSSGAHGGRRAAHTGGGRTHCLPVLGGRTHCLPVLDDRRICVCKI